MTTPLYLNGAVFDGITANFSAYTDVKVGGSSLANKPYVDAKFAAVPAGPTGATGLQGPAGAAGTNGAVGAAGPVGPVGPEGPVGAAGAPGANGADGAAGPAGDTIDTSQFITKQDEMITQFIQDINNLQSRIGLDQTDYRFFI